MKSFELVILETTYDIARKLFDTEHGTNMLFGCQLLYKLHSRLDRIHTKDKYLFENLRVTVLCSHPALQLVTSKKDS